MAETGKIAQFLAERGIVLPKPTAPAANYVPFTISGNLLVLAGQICLGADGTLAPEHKGKLGAGIDIPTGQACARLCGLNLLAHAQTALGSLDRITACLRLGGFINAAPDFAQVPLVMNGASDLMVEVFGESGRHARTTVGVAVLPFDAAVEVEALFTFA